MEVLSVGVWWEPEWPPTVFNPKLVNTPALVDTHLKVNHRTACHAGAGHCRSKGSWEVNLLVEFATATVNHSNAKISVQ